MKNEEVPKESKKDRKDKKDQKDKKEQKDQKEKKDEKVTDGKGGKKGPKAKDGKKDPPIVFVPAKAKEISPIFSSPSSSKEKAEAKLKGLMERLGSSDLDIDGESITASDEELMRGAFDQVSFKGKDEENDEKDGETSSEEETESNEGQDEDKEDSDKAGSSEEEDESEDNDSEDTEDEDEDEETKTGHDRHDIDPDTESEEEEDEDEEESQEEEKDKEDEKAKGSKGVPAMPKAEHQLVPVVKQTEAGALALRNSSSFYPNMGGKGLIKTSLPKLLYLNFLIATSMVIHSIPFQSNLNLLNSFFSELMP